MSGAIYDLTDPDHPKPLELTVGLPPGRRLHNAWRGTHGRCAWPLRGTYYLSPMRAAW